MTVQSTTQRNDYTGNGSTSAYSYVFRITEAQDLLVTVADTSTPPVEHTLVINTDYTISGVGASAGGTVTLVNASQSWLTGGNLTTGFHITVRRNPLLEQLTSIRNMTAFYPSTIEDGVDYIVMQIQALNNFLVRAPKLRETSTATPPTWPDLGSALQALRINAAGTGLEWFNPTASAGISYTPPAQGFSTEITIQTVLDILNPRIKGSRASPIAITSAGLSAIADVLEQVWFVVGSPGAVDLTSVSPQIVAGTRVGQKIEIIGTDNTNTLTLANGNGLVTNGSRVLEDGSAWGARWNGTAWQETYFNNL